MEIDRLKFLNYYFYSINSLVLRLHVPHDTGNIIHNDIYFLFSDPQEKDLFNTKYIYWNDAI